MVWPCMPATSAVPMMVLYCNPKLHAMHAELTSSKSAAASIIMHMCRFEEACASIRVGWQTPGP